MTRQVEAEVAGTLNRTDESLVVVESERSLKANSSVDALRPDFSVSVNYGLRHPYPPSFGNNDTLASGRVVVGRPRKRRVEEAVPPEVTSLASLSRQFRREMTIRQIQKCG